MSVPSFLVILLKDLHHHNTKVICICNSEVRCEVHLRHSFVVHLYLNLSADVLYSYLVAVEGKFFSIHVCHAGLIQKGMNHFPFAI